jgi:hypothetical protein
MDRIITLIINKLFRRSAKTSVAKGITAVAAKGKTAPHGTKLAKAQGNTARETAKRARQAAKLTRRMGR